MPLYRPNPININVGDPGLATIGTTFVNVANTAMFQKFGVNRPQTVTKAYFRLTIQSGNLDAGIYSSDGTTLTRISSSGTTACPAAANNASLTLGSSVLLVPGVVYYAAIASDNATASILGLPSTPAFAGTVSDAIGTIATSFVLPSTVLRANLVNGKVWGVLFA